MTDIYYNGLIVHVHLITYSTFKYIPYNCT